MKNWVIWIHLLHSFPAGLLLLLRLTYLSSSCCCQDCAASYMPAALISFMLWSVWRARIKVRAVLQLAMSVLASSKGLPRHTAC